MESYEALLVDPDVDSRAKLRQVALALPIFKKASPFSSLDKTLERLRTSEPSDVIFLSSKFEHHQISEFIVQAKQTKRGEDCAYIVVFYTALKDQSEIADTLLLGAHGILCEPYSVDRMREIAELASKIKFENAVKRKKAAISLLIGKIISEFDKLVGYMSRGLNVERAKRKFAENCGVLTQLGGEAFDSYIEVATSLFEQAAPSLATPYSGASKRIRERMEAKLHEEYEKEFGTEGPAKQINEAKPPN